MVTTIQIKDRTLLLLKKLKEETDSSSYDEAIKKMVLGDEESMAGVLSDKSSKSILKELQNERRKQDRF